MRSGPRFDGSCCIMLCAYTHAHDMANSSAPTSTRRNSTDCRFSSFGPKRAMAMNSVRPSLRDARSTKRRCARAGRTRRTRRARGPCPRAAGHPAGHVQPRPARPLSLSPVAAFGSTMAPARCRCGSTASRAMNRRMISLEPSKIRLMRRSRISARRDRLLAARLERRRGLVAAAAADLHAVVDDAPRALAVVHLRDRGLQPDVGLAGVRQARRRCR
jgi:hypothetical protein